jgi:PLP dependent protein
MNQDSGKTFLDMKKEIAESALKWGRKSEDISLIVVSKQHPWKEVKSVYEKGCRDFGESRIQEASLKISLAPKDIHWHLIGHLQKNKVKQAIGRFCLIHSIDTFELAKHVSDASQMKALKTAVLLQVNTSGEKTKQGMTHDECLRDFETLYQLPGIGIEGLMTMAPFTSDEKTIRECFSRCRELRDLLESKYSVNLPHLSMGMTNDYHIAIQEGATLIRLGTAIFGVAK